jgi:hypothetical protein
VVSDRVRTRRPAVGAALASRPPGAPRPARRSAEAVDASKLRPRCQKSPPASAARVARLEKRVSFLLRESKLQRREMKALWSELFRATDPHPK